MPLYKRCPRCGSRIPAGTTCACTNRRHKEYNQTRQPKHYSFYWSSAWEQSRVKAIQRTDGLDLYSLYVFNRTEIGYTVHHIIPLEDDYGLRCDTDNLIYLTESNHQAIHKAMRDGKKAETVALLRGLLRRYERDQKV